MPTDAERRRACTRFLVGDGYVSPARLLADIPSDVEPDTYGDGGVVEALETYVAELLGHEAAVYLPTGTMAQAATLRVHAEPRSSNTVLWHPHCHLDSYEGRGYARLHQLVGRPVGWPEALIGLADLTSVAEPFAALLLELPQRDLGGTLPTWDDLAEQLAWARSRGAAVHLDGARLWEAAAGYERSPAEVAGLFDTAYVSFYKGIGALPGCCVAGSAEAVSQVREWRRRLGGTQYGMWPGAASALALLPERLAEMPARLAHARAIAAALAGVEGVTVVPDPPQTPMMHLLFDAPAEVFVANARRLADDEGIWVWPKPMATMDPRVVRVELPVGRGTAEFGADEAAKLIAGLARSG